MNTDRITAFEEMMRTVISRYEEAVNHLNAMKKEGKEKTVTYRQYLSQKMLYDQMLSMYRSYGLLEQE